MNQLRLFGGLTPAPLRTEPPRPRVYRPQVREFRWPPGPRPWVGEIVRVVLVATHSTAPGMAGLDGTAEVVGVLGSLRDVVRVDATGLRRGAVVRLARWELDGGEWPTFAFRLPAREAWYAAAGVPPGAYGRPLRTAAGEAQAGQLDAERYLDRGLAWPVEADDG